MEDYPCDFMKALTRPSVDSVVASIPPIRELHLGEVSQRFSDVFFTRILPTNNLGLGLRYLYFSIWQVDDSESLSPLPFLITQQCPHLEVLLYFVPCPVTFLDDLPVRLKRLGVLLSVMEDVGCKDGTPRLSPQSILGWANDSERRKGVEALVVGWDRCIWKAKERDRAEGEKRLQSGVKEVHMSFSRFY
ncbi:hypothetical protein BDN72DRAFT_612709 [Pluteus cervinus]|uniref:Uncharacterized protein n=1 Tax=Pluteus cervinus TaxID=181527 RepID=A0ACD3AV77_9AGAR|nr:hypothetical protein BDN72DRAFT_612709 [Pluteus cervinus]